MTTGVEAVPAVQQADAARPWWETRLCLTLVVVATMLPLLYPPVPPLVDLLGHMGRYRVELDLDHSPWLQLYYDYHWAAIGNLGVDALVLVLAPLIGLEPAVKLIILAIPPLTAAGFLWVAREVHGRVPPTAFFALPFIYGFPFLFGFVNFALSMAFAFLAFGLWLKLGRLERTALRGWLFVPISIVVFFTHMFGWAMLGLMCLSAETVRLHDRGRSWFRAGFEAALHTSVMALPLLIMLVSRSEIRGAETFGWFEWKMKWRWIYGSLRDRWGYFDMGSLAFAGLILLTALVSRKLTLSRNLAFSAIVLAIAFAILPRVIFGASYGDMRLVPYVFAMMLLAIRFRPPIDWRLAQSLACMGVAFTIVRLAGTTASLAMAASDQRAKLAALDHVPRGARVASFYALPCIESWALPRNSHLGGMVIARREGFSNEQWLIDGVNLLQIKYRRSGEFTFDPSEVVRANGCVTETYRTIDHALKAVPRDAFDYVWLIDPQPYDHQLVADMEPVWSGPGTILYRIPR